MSLLSELTSGKKIVAASVYLNWTKASLPKRSGAKFGIVGGANAEPPEPAGGSGEQHWDSVALTKAEAEALSSKAALEAVKLFIEATRSDTINLYELCLLVEVEGGTKYNLFLGSSAANTFSIGGGGSALEAIGKTAVPPAAPSTGKELTSATKGLLYEGRLSLVEEEVVGKLAGSCKCRFGSSASTKAEARVSAHAQVVVGHAATARAEATLAAHTGVAVAGSAALSAQARIVGNASTRSTSAGALQAVAALAGALSVHTTASGGIQARGTLDASTRTRVFADGTLSSSEESGAGVLSGSAALRVDCTGALRAFAAIAGATSCTTGATAGLSARAAISGLATMHTQASATSSATASLTAVCTARSLTGATLRGSATLAARCQVLPAVRGALAAQGIARGETGSRVFVAGTLTSRSIQAPVLFTIVRDSPALIFGSTSSTSVAIGNRRSGPAVVITTEVE